jgi:mono/diheme cytochrome c family protein
MTKYLLVLLSALLAGCSDKEQSVSGRWYTATQIDNGAETFKNNCASCHGDNAQGIVPDWRKPLPDGSYPPPPLNGSAHAWHHPLKTLQRTIRNGGIPLGGKMPPFKDKLNSEEINSVIAFFQNKWSSEKYNAWLKRSGLE